MEPLIGIRSPSRHCPREAWRNFSREMEGLPMRLSSVLTRRNPTRIFVAAIGLSYLTIPAPGAPIGVATYTLVCFGPEGPSRVCQTRSGESGSANAMTSYSADETYNGGLGDSTYSLDGAGEASFTALRGYSELQVVSALSDLTQIGWRTISRIHDHLTIDGPGLTGSAGMLWFTLGLSGSGNGNSLPGPAVHTVSYLDWYAGAATATPAYERIDLNGKSVSTERTSATGVPFIFGGPPVDILIQIVVLAGADCDGPSCSNWGGSVVTDVSHTASVSGIALALWLALPVARRFRA